MLVRLLRTYLTPYKNLLAIVVVMQLIQTAANLYLPHLNASIIDNGVAKGNSHYIWTTGIWMLLLSLVQISANVGAVYFGAKSASCFGRDLRKAVFHRVQSYSAREVGQFGAPTLITRNTNDVQQVQILALTGANMLISAPITVIGGTIMALREDATLSWLLIICIPAMVGSLGLIISRLVPKFGSMQKRIDKVNQVLREQLAGMRVIRAFVREQHETDRFAVANTDVTRTAVEVGRLTAFMFPTVMLIFNASSVAVLWFGAQRVASGNLEVGGLIAFVTYLTQILLSVMFATFVATMIPRALVCANRIGEVLDTSSSVVPPEAPVQLGTDGMELRLNAAGFSYPGAEKAVLHDVSFVARAGQTTAIVGSTGAGKTTLMSLIPRLMDVTEGSVTINGADVREIGPETLAKLVGVVPQQPYLFSGTVATNLRYGNPDATDDELWHALRVAQADDFVAAMPEQLNAPISQGGTTVSGGQRQRLAIARALVHKPGIYLFDDSFSALDLATDAHLRAALVPETREATVVIVAQRISSIRHADQIIVLENGTMVGLGTHAELLMSCPTYAEIVKSQMSAEEAA